MGLVPSSQLWDSDKPQVRTLTPPRDHSGLVGYLFIFPVELGRLLHAGFL